MRHDVRGIVELPVILIIGAVFGTLVLAFGMNFLNNLQSMDDRQRANESFDSLVEKSYRVSLGGPGTLQHVELELPKGKISVKGKVLSLLIDDQICRVEFLPLPVQMDGQYEFELSSGYYLIELKLVSREMTESDNSLREGDYFLRLSDVAK